MKKLYFLLLIFSLSFFIPSVYAQKQFPFQNPDLSVTKRVNDLVSRMTVPEKIGQLQDQAPAIFRLGIPKYNWWNECLHGVARAGYATVYPQAVTMAASWNKGLIYEVASTISDEARAKNNKFIQMGERERYQGLTFWSPNINIFRDPRWGRGHETYGEDPFLTGQIGKEFVMGLQGNDDKYLKVVATAKHFAVHSGPESLRHVYNADISERDLRETYLPAFRTLVVDAKVESVMGAYNRFRGEACCASIKLNGILRNEWGFKGYVVSDCEAISNIWETHKIVPDAASAAALALKRGCDLNCGRTYSSLQDAFKKGQITEKELDVSVKRLFTARFELGMFDPLERVAYAQIPYSVNDNLSNNQLSRDVACESIVLLKNNDHFLPISKKEGTIAVIGPNSDDIQSLWGNYNGVPSHPVTVLDGIKKKVEPQMKVLYAQGCDLAEGISEYRVIPSIYLNTPDGTQGLKGEYFNNNGLNGSPLYTRTDDQINFSMDFGITPDPRLTTGNFSIRWTGTLTAPKTGTYFISGRGNSYMEIFCNGKSIKARSTRIRSFKLDLKKGEKYDIAIDYKNLYGDAKAKLLWSVPEPDALQQAVATAKKADIVVLVLGLNERLEGEEMNVHIEGFSGGDRTKLDLPETQRNLMKAIVATGKPVALVLINGGALSVNWASEHISGILEAGYPGEQGGNAIADVLFGDYNPAGRLPVTYYKSVDQLPPFEDYDMEGRTYRYFHQEPLYPFGYGLSYTKFEYSNLHVPEKQVAGEPVKISVDVTNTGDMDGDEVVQLYLTDEKASTPRPIRSLEGFDRINLKKGETKTVVFELTPRQFSIINKENKRIIEPGWFTISVGGEQPGFSGRCDAATTETIQRRIKLTGDKIEIK